MGRQDVYNDAVAFEHTLNLGMHFGEIAHVLKRVRGHYGIEARIRKRKLNSVVLDHGKDACIGISRAREVDGSNIESAMQQQEGLLSCAGTDLKNAAAGRQMRHDNVELRGPEVV